MIYYSVLILMTLIGAVASLFLKKASGGENILVLLRNRNLYFGGVLYMLSAVLNIYVLKYLEYSVVLPLTSLTYVWTMIISKVMLDEKITKKKGIGVTLILVGAIFIASK